jgi:pimeloyl-ACP methyl ester carboxylesterase
MSASSRRFIPTRLGTLAVRIRGHAKPPAVLWHGMFADSRSWVRVEDRLAQERTLYIVDGPGFGLSDPLRTVTTMQECADAAEDLLALLDVPAVDWVGTAWGGHIGLELAMRRSPRVRSLIALSAPVQRSSSLPALHVVESLVRSFGPRPVLGVLRRLQLAPASSADPALRDFIDDPTVRTSRASLANAIRSFVIDRHDITEQLDRIRIPTVMIASDQRKDWTGWMAIAAAQRIPAARVVNIAGARTQIQLERPNATIEAVITEWSRGMA